MLILRQGDHSYALMGLLRIRPKIDDTDTQFQAFARLSLANDSDMLLERLMCILPQNPTQHWSSVSDAYGVKVWDIYPTCQIAGVCSNDTVLVDGAFGATIHWDKFRKVANTRRKRSWKRLAIQAMLHGAPYFFLVGMLFFRSAWDTISVLRGTLKVIDDINDLWARVPGDQSEHFLSSGPATRKLWHWALFLGGIGFILVAIAGIVFISSPYLTRLLYGGKFCKHTLFVLTDNDPTNELIQGAHKHGSLALKGTSISRLSSPRFSVLECVASAGLSTAHPFHATARTSSMKVLVWTQQRTHLFVKRLNMDWSIPGRTLCAFSHWWIQIL
jgi:hypothetical protein